MEPPSKLVLGNIVMTDGQAGAMSTFHDQGWPQSLNWLFPSFSLLSNIHLYYQM